MGRLPQLPESVDLVVAGNEPEDAPCAIERGIGQGHAATTLVRARDGDVTVGDVEHGVAGNEGGRVAVRTESEMHEIEDLRQRVRVRVCGSLEICVLDRHRMDGGSGVWGEARE